MKPKLFQLLMLLMCLAGLEKAGAHDLVLQWNASASPAVAGYNIYYGTTSGAYSMKLNAGNLTVITITNLTPGVTYYFAATAYDGNGDESGFSAEVSFVVPGILTVTPGANPGDPPLIRFPVEPGHSYEVQATTDLQTWTSIWQSEVATSNYWMQFTDPEAGSFPSRFYRLVLQ